MFSIIIPTMGEPELAYTLSSLIYQSAPQIHRDIIVVGDGLTMKQIQTQANVAIEYSRKLKQSVDICCYAHKKVGDVARLRNHGLFPVKRGYVMYMDAGSALVHDAFKLIESVAGGADLIAWSTMLNVVPVPRIMRSRSVYNWATERGAKAGEGMPYLLPTIGAAVKREYVGTWVPHEATEYPFWSDTWSKLPRPLNVAIIPECLALAYSARLSRGPKVSEPMPIKDFVAKGFNVVYEGKASSQGPVKPC